jgi:hypothetical protein
MTASSKPLQVRAPSSGSFWTFARGLDAGKWALAAFPARKSVSNTRGFISRCLKNVLRELIKGRRVLPDEPCLNPFPADGTAQAGVQH